MLRSTSTIQHNRISYFSEKMGNFTVKFSVFPHFPENRDRYQMSLNDVVFRTTSTIQHNMFFLMEDKFTLKLSVFQYFLENGYRYQIPSNNTVFQTTSTIQHKNILNGTINHIEETYDICVTSKN